MNNPGCFIITSILMLLFCVLIMLLALDTDHQRILTKLDDVETKSQIVNITNKTYIYEDNDQYKFSLFGE
jgi:hypothetical protein